MIYSTNLGPKHLQSIACRLSVKQPTKQSCTENAQTDKRSVECPCCCLEKSKSIPYGRTCPCIPKYDLVESTPDNTLQHFLRSNSINRIKSTTHSTQLRSFAATKAHRILHPLAYSVLPCLASPRLDYSRILDIPNLPQHHHNHHHQLILYSTASLLVGDQVLSIRIPRFEVYATVASPVLRRDRNISIPFIVRLAQFHALIVLGFPGASHIALHTSHLAHENCSLPPFRTFPFPAYPRP